MKVYTYEVVSSNGAGVHSRGHLYCSLARRAAERVAAENAKSSVNLGPFEIQRIEWVDRRIGGTRRYWMRQRSRWVPWNPHRDIDERHPDWLYGRVAELEREANK